MGIDITQRSERTHVTLCDSVLYSVLNTGVKNCSLDMPINVKYIHTTSRCVTHY